MLPSLNSIATQVLLTMVHFLWQGAVLFGVAVLVTVVLRRRSPNLRYGIQLALLLLMAVCPVVTFFVAIVPPDPQVALQFAPKEPTESVTIIISEPTGDASEPEWTALWTVDEERLATEAEKQPAGDTSRAVARDQPAAQPTAARNRASRSVVHEILGWCRPHSNLVLRCYLIGVALFLLRLMLGIEGGHRLRRRSVDITDDVLTHAITRCREVVRLKSEPVVRMCNEIAVPAVVGVFWPAVLLPVRITTTLTTEQIEAILIHELTHIRRRDHLINILQRVIEAFLFFHPGVWWLSSRLRLERELCCDRAVIESGRNPIDYAETLVESAADLQQRSRFAVAAVFAARSRSELAQRVKWLLTGATGRLRLASRRGLLSGLAITLFIASGTCASRQEMPDFHTLRLLRPVFLCYIDGEQLDADGSTPIRHYMHPNGIPGDFSDILSDSRMHETDVDDYKPGKWFSLDVWSNDPGPSERMSILAGLDVLDRQGNPIRNDPSLNALGHRWGEDGETWDRIGFVTDPPEPESPEPLRLPAIVDYRGHFWSGPYQVYTHIDPRNFSPIDLPDGTRVVDVRATRKGNKQDSGRGSSTISFSSIAVDDKGNIFDRQSWTREWETPAGSLLMERLKPAIESHQAPIVSFSPKRKSSFLNRDIPSSGGTFGSARSQRGDENLRESQYWTFPFAEVSHIEVGVVSQHFYMCRNLATRPTDKSTGFYIAWPVSEEVPRPELEFIRAADSIPSTRVRLRYPTSRRWSYHPDPNGPRRWKSFLKVDTFLIPVDGPEPFSGSEQIIDLQKLGIESFEWTPGSHRVAFVVQNLDVNDEQIPDKVFYVHHVESEPVRVDVRKSASVGQGEMDKWSDELGGLRLQASFADGHVLTPGVPLPVQLRLQNVSPDPIPYSALPDRVGFFCEDLVFEWHHPAILPWEARSGTLAPGAVIEWTDRLDRKQHGPNRLQIHRGERRSIRYWFNLDGESVESNTLKLTFDGPPVDELGEIPAGWGRDMQFDWEFRNPWNGTRQFPRVQLHIDGDGVADVVVDHHRVGGATGESRGPQRFQLRFSPEELRELCREMQRVELTRLYAHGGKGPAQFASGEFTFVLSDGGNSCGGRF